MGTTSTFVKSRVSKPTVGKWSSGFSAVKKYAEEKKIPLVAVWSNGDSCDQCVKLEEAMMGSEFRKWMSESGCVFWFGCSTDAAADDRRSGTGHNWTKNSKLTQYPFMRVWWKDGKVDECRSGKDWLGGDSSGEKLVAKLKKVLKDFCSDCQWDGDGCEGGECVVDLGGAKMELSKLKEDFALFRKSFEKRISDLEKKI